MPDTTANPAAAQPARAIGHPFWCPRCNTVVSLSLHGATHPDAACIWRRFGNHLPREELLRVVPKHA